MLSILVIFEISLQRSRKHKLAAFHEMTGWMIIR